MDGEIGSGWGERRRLKSRQAIVAEALRLLASYSEGADVQAELWRLVGEMKEPCPDPLPQEAAPQSKADERKAIAQRVFEYWQDRTGHSKARLTPERATKIFGRLREGYTEQDLKLAIEGCLASDFHQGRNEAGVRYDGIELILRNGSNVERFRGLAGSGRIELQERSSASPEEAARARAHARAQKALEEGKIDEYNEIVRPWR